MKVKLKDRSKVSSLLEWCLIISIEVSGDHSQLRCRGFVEVINVRTINWISLYSCRSKAIKRVSFLINVA